MAKDKSTDPALKKEKKEKKDKKRKHSDIDPTTAVDVDDSPEPAPKKEKKEKKDKKRKSTGSAVVDVDGDGDVTIADTTVAEVEVKEEDGKEVKVTIPIGALVPFANPLADGKEQKKVLKSVKKAAKNKALKRGVKECVKSIRKSPPANPSTDPSSAPPGIVILAADISPMDVISHIPVLCEDHNIPYIYVPSRAELGAAGSTKRPTSVVMLTPKVGKGAKAEEGGEKEWAEAYGDLHKLALKMGQTVKV